MVRKSLLENYLTRGILLSQLKEFTAKIYQYYLNLEQTARDEETASSKKLRSSYAKTCQTVLFFNQSQPDMGLEEWCARTPVSYQLQVDHFIGLLEESARWAVSAISMGEGYEPPALKERMLVDIENYSINVFPTTDDDSITAQFTRTCVFVHNEIPANLRKRKALIRLIWAYVAAKDLTAMAKDFSACDRVEYLRRLTK